MRPLRDNALTLVFGALFFLALAGQAVAGFLDNNEILSMHGMPLLTFGAYLTSADFTVDVAENWQSEFLQFFLFIAATVWLVQRGSPESKRPGDEGPGDDKEQLVGEYAVAGSPSWARARGIRQVIYSNSLLLVMGVIFLLSWLAQSLGGVNVANEENAQHGMPSDHVARLHRLARFLVAHAAELAVGVPRGRSDDRALDLSASAGIERVQAGGRTSPHDVGVIRLINSPSRRMPWAESPRHPSSGERERSAG